MGTASGNGRSVDDFQARQSRAAQRGAALPKHIPPEAEAVDCDCGSPPASAASSCDALAAEVAGRAGSTSSAKSAPGPKVRRGHGTLELISMCSLCQACASPEERGGEGGMGKALRSARSGPQLLDLILDSPTVLVFDFRAATAWAGAQRALEKGSSVLSLPMAS